MNPYKFVLIMAGFSAAAWGQVQTITVDVPVNQAWTRTGIFLNPGSTVLLEARGLVEAVPASDTRAAFHRVPPEGRRERLRNTPQPLLPALGLLARIGQGPVMDAGARAEFPVGDPYGSGELQLGINDDHVADNTGSWNVRVTVRGVNPTISQQRRGGGRYYGDDAARRRDVSPGASAIDSKAQQLGSGFLGDPVSDIRTAQDGIGRSREYRNGSIYWSPDTGAHEIHGAIRDKWISVGAENGQLGYPTTDEMQARDGFSRMVRFQRGTITWNDRTGARVDLFRQ